MDNEVRKINIKSLLLTLVLTITIIGLGTYAWLTYRSKNTAMVLTIGDINSVQITLKPYQLDMTLSPMLTYTSLDTTGDYVTVTVTNSTSSDQKFSLFYDINYIDSGLQNSSFKYTILKTNDNTTTEGDFTNSNTTDNFYILDKLTIPASTTYTYKVYVWLDGNTANTPGLSFKADLRAEILEPCKELTISPVLDEGMIPVTIADDGTVTTVASSNSNWYSYCEQKWANTVLVKETGVKTRAQNKVAGTVINQDDILAYYVWIPRYSYKIWTLDASQAHTGEEQTIDIKFVDTSTKETGSAVGQWYTHPAFTFGTEELAGIWVGKFEMSHNTLSSSTTSNNLSCTTETCTNASGLRVLPNVSSIRYNNVSNMWYAARSMEQSNNVFGITNSDSHMMKNSEWGAVAYLSHSNYGINDEIRINNYRKDTTTYATLTGCGASTANASVAATCNITYGSASSYPQSTTGNISGIFDMSGGAWEYVMGNYNNTIGSSGFSTLPNAKYYDNYPASIFAGDYNTNMTFCTLETCGGHALNETRAWYSDYANFVNSSSPWFRRGGYYVNSRYAGAFISDYYNGNASGSYSWRGVFAAR